MEKKETISSMLKVPNYNQRWKEQKTRCKDEEQISKLT